MSSTLREWVASSSPPVPAAFVQHLIPGRGDAPATSSTLLDEARSALQRALACDPADRRGAFELLAADAWATWAAEAALTAEDPEVELLDQVRALQAATPSDE